ncbi:MAG: cytochrome b/b6 domain-containing protein [Sphingobium sp.]
MAPRTNDPLIYRHRLPTRLWHWINALCLYVLFTSGLGIFNAHPRLYWGEYGANFDPAWLELSRFPGWLTLPSWYSLALSRHWHLLAAPIFIFALLLYMMTSLANGHFRRDIAFRREELRPAHIWQDIKDHARLRFPRGAAAMRYNVLQKGVYAKIIFLFLPVMILTGLAMSPGMDAAWPWLTQIWGGRQTARSVHFIAAWCLVALVAVHLLALLLAGPLGHIRAMITGWYRVPPPRPDDTREKAGEKAA